MERWQKERLDRAREALEQFINRAELERSHLQTQIEEARRALASLPDPKRMPTPSASAST